MSEAVKEVRPRSSRMRVLAVLIRTNLDNEIGGSERSFVELSNALVQEGVEVDTLEIGSSVACSVTSRANHYVLNSSGNLPLRLFRYSFDALRIARSRDCEVIFAPAVYWPQTIFVALLTSFVLRRPLFIGIPGPFKGEEDKLTVPELLKQRLEGRRALKTTTAAVLRRLAFRSANGLLFATNHLAQDYGKKFSLKNAVVIGRGVNDFWFQPDGSPATKEYDAVFVGRLDEGKGVDTLIRAWDLVGDSLPSARLLVVGTGPRADEYKRIAGENRLGHNIKFVGYVNDPLEVKEKVQSSRLLVLPSEDEGFARVVSEAMACGVPCVISDIPGLRETYSGAAVFVPSKDSTALAQAIISLLVDGTKLGQLSRTGMIHARKFSWSNSAALTYNAFAEACNRAPWERVFELAVVT